MREVVIRRAAYFYGGAYLNYFDFQVTFMAVHSETQVQ